MADVANPAARIREILRGSATFGVLPEAVLDELGDALVVLPVRGGEVVFREGDVADSMFILLAGRLRVSRRDAQGGLSLYNEIVPGESVGETGMILRQRRAADVTAIRDSTLAVLERSAFEALLVRHPLPLNRVFAQAIYNHLRHTPQPTDRRVAQTIAVLPLHRGGAAAEVAAGLAKAFGRLGKTRHVRWTSASEGGDVVSGQVLDGDGIERLEREFDYLVHEADFAAEEPTRKAFHEADQIIFVAAAGVPPEQRSSPTRLRDDPSFELKRKHLAILHRADARHAMLTVDPAQDRDFERAYPLRAGVTADYDRLVRFLTSRAVGVVLGGGGARGFAHLGVLRALEEASIPIDIIGGNSMGALIGAQYASGIPIEAILERTRDFALGGEWPTVPVISLLSGRRIERDLRRMFGDLDIEQLWRPFFAAACNLSRAATTVQDRGPLWRAVLASNSPAGLLPPVLHHGELLVDGAILDNVPVGAMRQRLGAPMEKRRGNGTIIAIDVDVQQDLGVPPDVGRLSVWKSVKGHLPGVTGTQPGIGDILYRAGHIGGLNQRDRTIKLADHYLEPPVAEFPLMAYRVAERIVEVGYRYAQGRITQWDRSALGI